MNVEKTASQYPFADYFIICGLDLHSGLEPDQLTGDINAQRTPLDRSYKCQVLVHYPDSVPWNPFDSDSVCMLCLPDGLRFKTQKHALQPTFHSFIITRQNGSRCYGFSYIFYERAHKKICNAMQVLQSMHFTEMSANSDNKHRKKNIQLSYNTRSLPRHFKMMSQPSVSAHSYYDITKDTLYVNKSIVLISQMPYVNASQMFLTSLYKVWKSERLNNLESYVNYIVNEVAVPDYRCSLSFYAGLNKKTIIYNPGNVDELPLFDYAIREVFNIIDFECLIHLFTSALLENQIMLRSKEHKKLMLITEAINCLLFPFSWPHVYVPILPSAMENFLDAPVPFIMGLATCEARCNIPSEANLCFVDVEMRTIQLPEDLPIFPNRSDFISELKAVLSSYDISCQKNYSELRHSDVNTKMKRNSSVTCLLDETSTSPEPSDYKQDVISSSKIDCGQEDGETDISQYVQDHCFNTAVREIFLNMFLRIFSNYENFVVQHYKSHDDWIDNRERLASFDKNAFLSEQPAQHIPFLSRFIETQMFTNFIDDKIQSGWSDLHPYISVFDTRIQLLKERKEQDVNICVATSSSSSLNDRIIESQQLIKNYFTNVDTEIPKPEELFANNKLKNSSDTFPLVNISKLNQHLSNKKINKNPVNLDNGIASSTTSKELSKVDNHFIKCASEAHPLGHSEKLTLLKQPEINISQTQVTAHTNWNFVEKLLKDCKNRTKRMLVAKMGYEAVELGHKLQNMIVEENTLVVGLCDLLERIWSHGLQDRQKSALWFHLITYQKSGKAEANEGVSDIGYHRKTGGDGRYLLRSSSASRVSTFSTITPSFDTDDHMTPLPTSLTYDIKTVESISDIRTPVGLAKSWIRLCLERKLLSRHLRCLLSDKVLIRNLYKRYAFLRCEEEKEQFLCHLLTLNAADYYCFTNTYINARLPYRVVICSPTRVTNWIASGWWIILSGTHGESNVIHVPKGQSKFIFYHKNLGILTALRIGQNHNSVHNTSAKLILDKVLVRNEATGHIYSFFCGRWLGCGVDDHATERILTVNRTHGMSERGRNATRSSSLIDTGDKPSTSDLTYCDIQQQLGECVNNIVKYFYGKMADNTCLAVLICGDSGLVSCLSTAFSFGFRCTRLFSRKLYVWDFILKVRQERSLPLEQMSHYDKYFIKLVDEIQVKANRLGKDGSFQVFACICVRDHMLQHILGNVLAVSRAACEMYDVQTFLRSKPLLTFLIQLLESLNDFHIKLENVLTLGITVDVL